MLRCDTFTPASVIDSPDVDQMMRREYVSPRTFDRYTKKKSEYNDAIRRRADARARSMAATRRRRRRRQRRLHRVPEKCGVGRTTRAHTMFVPHTRSSIPQELLDRRLLTSTTPAPGELSLTPAVWRSFFAFTLTRRLSVAAPPDFAASSARPTPGDRRRSTSRVPPSNLNRPDSTQLATRRDGKFHFGH